MTSFPAPTGFAPSYSWIGAPTTFNGTDPLSGGDSGQSTSHRHAYIIFHNHPPSAKLLSILATWAS